MAVSTAPGDVPWQHHAEGRVGYDEEVFDTSYADDEAAFLEFEDWRAFEADMPTVLEWVGKVYAKWGLRLNRRLASRRSWLFSLAKAPTSPVTRSSGILTGLASIFVNHQGSAATAPLVSVYVHVGVPTPARATATCIADHRLKFARTAAGELRGVLRNRRIMVMVRVRLFWALCVCEAGLRHGGAR